MEKMIATNGKRPGLEPSDAGSKPGLSPWTSRSRSGLNGDSHTIERLLTSKEASEVLKIHPKVLERMAKRGDVPALKVGKFWRYRASTLNAWINSRLQSGRQPCRMETSF